MNTAKAS